MIFLLALGAALAFGTSVAVQERAAAEVPYDHALKVGLVVRLARRPLWWIGVVASVAGLVLQIWALRHDSLVVVQPLMVTTLVFALVLVAIRTREADDRLVPGSSRRARTWPCALGIRPRPTSRTCSPPRLRLW